MPIISLGPRFANYDRLLALKFSIMLEIDCPSSLHTLQLLPNPPIICCIFKFCKAILLGYDITRLERLIFHVRLHTYKRIIYSYRTSHFNSSADCTDVRCIFSPERVNCISPKLVYSDPIKKLGVFAVLSVIIKKCTYVMHNDILL